MSDRVEAAREAISRSGVPDPVFIQTESGGTEFFWPVDARRDMLTIEVELDDSVYVHAVDLDAGTYADATISADEQDLAAALRPWLTAM